MNFRHHLLKVDGVVFWWKSIGRLSSLFFFRGLFILSHKAYQLTEAEVEPIVKVFETEIRSAEFSGMNEIGKTSLVLGVTSMPLVKGVSNRKSPQFLPSHSA